MIDGYTKAGPDIQENLQDYFDCMNLNISKPGAQTPTHLFVPNSWSVFKKTEERSSFHYTLHALRLMQITRYIGQSSQTRKV